LSKAKSAMDLLSFSIVPGFHFVQPGLQQLQTTNKKKAERRQADVFRWSAPQTSLRSLRKPSASGAARALTRRARLTAFHRGTCGCRRALSAVPYQVLSPSLRHSRIKARYIRRVGNRMTPLVGARNYQRDGHKGRPYRIRANLADSSQNLPLPLTMFRLRTHRPNRNPQAAGLGPFFATLRH